MGFRTCSKRSRGLDRENTEDSSGVYRTGIVERPLHATPVQRRPGFRPFHPVNAGASGAHRQAGRRWVVAELRRIERASADRRIRAEIREGRRRLGHAWQLRATATRRRRRSPLTCSADSAENSRGTHGQRTPAMNRPLCAMSSAPRMVHTRRSPCSWPATYVATLCARPSSNHSR